MAPDYIRQFSSLLVSSGGAGKSSLLLVEALALVTGKALLGKQPKEQYRVWYWNGEDPQAENDRRLAAVCKYYGLTASDIGNRLFVDSGRTLPIKIATKGRNGSRIVDPVVEGVLRTLNENQIDVLIIDPFISSHAVEENNNDDMTSSPKNGVTSPTR
jgi:RecA-family ATPase